MKAVRLIDVFYVLVMKVLCWIWVWFGCVSGDSREYTVSVEQRESKVFTDAAAAAADDDDDDDDDNEYFEDDNSLVPSLSELRQQIVGAVGESLFNRVYGLVQVSSALWLLCSSSMLLLYQWYS